MAEPNNGVVVVDKQPNYVPTFRDAVKGVGFGALLVAGLVWASVGERDQYQPHPDISPAIGAVALGHGQDPHEITAGDTSARVNLDPIQQR